MASIPSTPTLSPDKKGQGPVDTSASTSNANVAGSTATPPPKPSRIFSTDNVQATGKFLKAFGKTAVGMHPLWLMGEAVTGKKVGTQMRSGSKELIEASEAMRDLVATSASDIVIIVNEKLREKSGETAKTADVIKRAGDNAIVVVSSSIEKAHDQLQKNSPALKRSIQKNGREVIVVVDKALKHPLVITGIHNFARSQGIPRPEAILTLASLALSKILASLPTDEELAAMAAAGGQVDEIDASELERTSSKEADAEATAVGKASQAPMNRSATSPGPSGSNNNEKKKDGNCIIV
ncbi:hypothetical protein FRB96_002549 [Tulasnella sp. 330]|nr:hypothetical protein FRB96_002549 [Tulasnella sp. 330]